MPRSLALLILLIIPGCAELALTPAEQHQADMQAIRTWVRGPLAEICPGLPGQESRRACAMVQDSVLAKIRGTSLTHQDHFRIELAKVKATDEIRRLWTRTEQETWLRGPKTYACKQAPLAAYADECLQSVEDDVVVLSFPDSMEDAQAVVRAEQAVGRIEASTRTGVGDGQGAQDIDFVQQEVIEPTLLVLGIRGELFGTSMATLPSQNLHQPVTQMPLTSLLPYPPVFCTSQHVGQMISSTCY